MVGHRKTYCIVLVNSKKTILFMHMHSDSVWMDFAEDLETF